MIKTYVIGDIHGSFKPIRDFHLRHNTNKEYNEAEKYMICLGDFCVNYFLDEDENHRDRNTKQKLGRYPFTYFVIRGNHEERPENLAKKHPDKWYQEVFWNGPVWVEKDFPYIKYALDGPGLYDIPCGDIELNTLTLPGAYSVDKEYRLMMGYSWFPDEQMKNEEKELAWDYIRACHYNFDLVLSHTCPCCYEPTDLFLKSIDQSKVDKDMERFLGAVEYALEDYKAWLWGHYHAFRDYPRTNGRRKTMLYSQEVIDLEQYMNNDEVIKL